MWTLLRTCLFLSLILTAQPAHARDTVVVMTQNQYFGADLTPVIGATTPEEVNRAALEALAQIQAHNFPERARAMAEQIADWQPDVVGLQEAFRFTLNGTTTPGVPPFIDQVDETLTALNALDTPYDVGAVVRNIEHTFEDVGDVDGDSLPDDIGVTDRVVILVRSGIPFDVVDFPCAPQRQSADGCNYAILAPTGLGPLKRGFVGIDATIKGRVYRFVNTHLEIKEVSEAIQALQAGELIGILQAPQFAGLPTVVLGDINSSPRDISYEQFIAANFNDIWDLRPGNAPGLTCCQAADLANPRSELYERVDMIFTTFEPRKVKARRVGHRVADKTRPGRLWPSDHAGVVAKIRVD